MKIPLEVELLISARIEAEKTWDNQNAYVFGFLTGIQLSRKLLLCMKINTQCDYLHKIARTTYDGPMLQLEGMSVNNFQSEVLKASDWQIQISNDDIFGSRFMSGSTGHIYAKGMREAVELIRCDAYYYFRYYRGHDAFWEKLIPWIDQVEKRAKQFIRIPHA